MDPVTLLIVDDHPIVREGLRNMLAAEPSVQVVGEAEDGDEAIARVEELHPQVVLMDIRMPKLDGLQTCRAIKASCPDTAVVMLTVYDGDAYVIDAVRAGASGYLLKDASQDLLTHTVKSVSSGGLLIKSSLIRKALEANERSQEQASRGARSVGQYESLTARELQVLTLIVEGATNKKIALQLGLAEDTIKRHVQTLIAKLQASSRTQAAVRAVRMGLLQPDNPPD